MGPGCLIIGAEMWQGGDEYTDSSHSLDIFRSRHLLYRFDLVMVRLQATAVHQVAKLRLCRSACTSPCSCSTIPRSHVLCTVVEGRILFSLPLSTSTVLFPSPNLHVGLLVPSRVASRESQMTRTVQKASVVNALHSRPTCR